MNVKGLRFATFSEPKLLVIYRKRIASVCACDQIEALFCQTFLDSNDRQKEKGLLPDHSFFL